VARNNAGFGALAIDLCEDDLALIFPTRVNRHQTMVEVMVATMGADEFAAAVGDRYVLFHDQSPCRLV
jgi:hypothetical protein